MLFAKTLALGVSFVGAALAQAKIGFTQQPSSVQAGVPVTLKWAGGDENSLVTITLQQGDSGNLQTVSIITGKGTGNSFTWTPSSDLPNAQDYTLKISQGLSDVNYSGRFSLSGGSESSTSVPVTQSASVITSVITSAPSSKTPAATTLSVTAILNSTLVATTAVPLNATTPVLIGTAGTGAGLGSTGIPISRNTTLSRATLTVTSSSRVSSSASGTGSASGSASGSGSSSGTGSSNSPSSTTSAPGNSATKSLASPLALVLSAIAAIIYLG